MGAGALAQAGLNVAQGVVNTGMGLLLEKHNDKRQLKQQRKLQQLQIEGQQQMTDYNMMKQLQMWKDTNYGPQMEQLKAAGLNPGLIYGMSGGGATTTGTANGNVSAGEAPKGGQEIIAQQGMGIQRELLQAQKDLLVAQKNKTEAETPNLPLTGENIKADTAGKIQNIENLKAQQQRTLIENEISKIQLDFDKESLKNRLSTVNLTLSKLIEDTQVAGNERKISDATVKTHINLIKQELANKILDSYLKSAQTKNINQDTLNKIQEVKNMVEKNMREWDKLGFESQTSNIEWYEHSTSGDFPHELKEMLDNVLIIPRLGKGSHTPIKGFKQ